LALGATFAGTAYAEDCTAKIGVAGPLSGGAAEFGLAAKAATEFEAAYENAHGGVQIGDKKCQVKVFSYDSKYTIAGGAAAADYMASQGVHATMVVTSLETKGLRPVAARDGIVAFNTAYLKDAISPEFPLVFHASQMPITWGPLLVKAAVNVFHFKTVLIAAANDEGGKDGGAQLAKLYDQAGIKATLDYFQRGSTNFAPLVQRLMNANPDVVELATTPPADGELIVKQLYEAGFNGIIGSLGGVGLKPIMAGAGGEANLKNVYYLEIAPTADPGVIKMKEDYKKLMGADAPTNGLFPIYVAASEVLLHAYTKAGTDQDGPKIAEAIRSTAPDSRYLGKHGWRGKSRFGINQEFSFPTGLGLIKDGKRLPVVTVQIPAED
jgi:branched-chain amino acid transport system substrate-binding protein